MIKAEELIIRAHKAADQLIAVITEHTKQFTKEALTKIMPMNNEFLAVAALAASLISAQETELKQLQNRLTEQMKSDCSNGPIQRSIDACETLSELAERNTRTKNVIFIGIPEIDDSLPQKDHSSEDLKQITEMVDKVDEKAATKIIRCYRLGLRKANNSRPIKVIFQDAEYSDSVLYGRQRFPQNIKVRHDLTIVQRDHLKMLWSEIDERKKKGETNLTVKYINNTPKIVTDRKKNFSRVQ
jgi:hypothetical protein